ncbi:regulator of microtubule dynamics protein 1-like isoform X2 [Sitodiplosis mosellana]|uniref:regulator of microtubule dynamics protein 1-like isoform X2 n=1 Tax=Sitodiplosis mosellana TaxID=263140 RepID=UPI002443F53D|nr:regulator of microtubule dynamics protein 1-like isoform X2 [Sitodiplosis mosellana]
MNRPLHWRSTYAILTHNFRRSFQSPEHWLKCTSRLLFAQLQNCRKFPCRREIGWTLTLIGSSKVKMAEETDLQHLLQNADQLFDENQYQEAIDLLKKFPNQSDANILWREARALFKLSGTNKAKKEESIREGYELIQKALELDENNYACHKWMAVLLDAKSELDGIKVRVGQLANVKKHMQKAVDLNSEDPTNWHLLGNFAFGLADMPWYQRKIVSAIFATPPTGTYEEALDYFLKAEEKKANFYSMNLLFIGKCYYNMKNNEKAKEFITRAANVQVVNEDDKKCKEEATALLKKL